jgi:hypothetical protein
LASDFVNLRAVILRRTQKYACESRPLLFASSIQNRLSPKYVLYFLIHFV